MIKLYTPAQWHSIFQNPTIIIEDDGMIYSEEDYYKTFRNPLGKVEYSEGFIYGPDYHRWPRNPIGKIETADGVTRIYGPDYYRLGARPLYHVRDNWVYTDDEFYKLFPNQAFRVDGSIGSQPSGGSQADASYSGCSDEDYDSGSRSSGKGSKFFSILYCILGIIAIAAISGALWKIVYIDDSEFRPQFIANIVCLTIGALVALFHPEKEAPPSIIVFLTSGACFWIYIVAGLIADIGFTFAALGLSLAGLLIAALFCILPSIAIGLIVKILRKIINR